MPKKTFEAAALADAHLIVQLKDNQPILGQKVEAVCAAAEPLSSLQTVDEKRRNRHETRVIAVFDAAPAVTATEWGPHVSAIIKVAREVIHPPSRHRPLEAHRRKSRSICPVAPSPLIVAADAIRKHWGIENKSHYTRDVSFPRGRLIDASEPILALSRG